MNVQGSRSGGQFAINLGIHPLAIADVTGNIPDPKKITEPLCEFRRRLTESGVDQWWDHSDSQESMDSAVTAATRVYIQIGRPMLARIVQPDSPFSLVSAEDFNKDQMDLLAFGSTDVRTALVFARIRKEEGRLRESRDFAMYGLAHVGRATGLKAKLEELSCESA